MMEEIKRLLRKPTPVELAARELAEAERDLLRAQTGVEYAQSDVIYHTTRIKRLRKFLAECGDDKN